jgi:hypothetical protein
MFSFHKKISTGQWLSSSCIVFAAHFVLGVILVMALNGKMINHGLTPIFTNIDVFKLIWPEHPLASLHFLATKSIFVFSHYDARSALSLWTLEYDFYTLLVYLTVSLSLGRILASHRNEAWKSSIKPIFACFTSAFIIAFSISYMTVLEHCSGATWVGFVSLYGMGFTEFELYPRYQIITVIIGILGFSGSLVWLIRAKYRGFS